MGAALQPYSDQGQRKDPSLPASPIVAPLGPGPSSPALVEFRHGRWWDGFYLLWVILRFIIVAEWAARARETYGTITGRGADHMAPRG